jgi:hypothetical protein
VTREHSIDELRQLDAGFGYTADHGRTFPFRGKGVGPAGYAGGIWTDDIETVGRVVGRSRD